MVTLSNWLKKQRIELENRLTRRGLAHTLSLARSSLHRETIRLIDLYARGRCLDVGSGKGPYRDRLRTRCEKVITLDVEKRTEAVDLIGDIQAMSGVDSASFDTVLCTQVLEHVPRPWLAMAEIARVLKPEGKLILSVPHLSAIHEAPNDFYRYTSWGLEALAQQAGLKIEEIRTAGGLLAFLGHGASYLLMSTLGTLPFLRWIVWFMNALVMVLLLGPLDTFIGLRSIYPCNFVLVAGLDTTSDE